VEGDLMTETSPIHPLSTFVLRFWREWSAGERQWRGRIEHVQSGASATFLELEEMVDFILGIGIMAEDRNQSGKLQRGTDFIPSGSDLY
jgi:hypothetical protein